MLLTAQAAKTFKKITNKLAIHAGCTAATECCYKAKAGNCTQSLQELQLYSFFSNRARGALSAGVLRFY